MKQLHRRVYIDYRENQYEETIAATLGPWFTKRVLEAAAEEGCVATVCSPSGKKYTLESARLGKAAAVAPGQVKEEPSAPLSSPSPRDPPPTSSSLRPACDELVCDELSAG